MLISVVMPVYNEKNTIQQQLGKVQAVEMPFKKEIIIVDDRSTDSTGKQTKKDLGPL